MLISLIIPCFNEEEALPVFYEELSRVTKTLLDYEFEFLFIDDGSSDNTLGLLCDLSKRDDRVKYISFSRNFGKEAAMYCGFCNCNGDYVAVMDADMQDPPSLLPKMLEIVRSGEYDSVATCRSDRTGEPVVRSFFARMFYRIINKISDSDIVDGARDFRLMTRKMVDAIVKMSEYNRFSKGIFGWIGFRTYWLPYENIERVAGKTKWSFWKLLKYSIDGFINHSQFPLAISSWSGILCTLLSFLMVIAIVIRKIIFGNPVAGWASTVCIILFVSGIQLFCTGIMGQYIAKMYLETKKRPHYIVAKTNKDKTV